MQPGTVKEEDVIDLTEVEPVESMHFDEDTKNAYTLLQNAVKTYCSVYTTTCKDLVDIQEDSAADDLSDTVDLVLTDPPYNTRRTGNRSQSDHDKLSETECRRLLISQHGKVLKISNKTLEFYRYLRFQLLRVNFKMCPQQ